MQYHHIDYAKTRAFCIKAFQGYGFTQKESIQITDVLLDADLSGIESHGVQRMIRYHKEITEGMAKIDAKPQIVKQTPLSVTIEGNDAMGQVLSVKAMEMAIDKAKQHGIGMVTVRNSNHYGIAGFYTRMAAQQGLIGICMTNSEAIMVPTFGKEAMLGTNPIAFSMPASPIPFTFDAATTVVPRGKLEVYAKRDGVIKDGWALDENGHPSTDASRVLNNIIQKSGGGILPLGGAGEATSGYKGYGFGMICEICTAILSGGLTSNHVNRTPGRTNICHFFMAVDYSMFGEKEDLEAGLSQFLEELRQSPKADGAHRIYTHGEKEFENRQRVMAEGIVVNEKTYAEMQMIAQYTGASELLPEYLD